MIINYLSETIEFFSAIIFDIRPDEIQKHYFQLRNRNMHPLYK
jgi:hypothetical protein